MTGMNLDRGTMSALITKLLMRVNTETLAAGKTIVAEDYPVHFLDPGGAARTVTLPPEADSDGLFFIFMNTADAAEIITIQDDASAAVVTPTQNEAAVVFCDGVTWRGFVATEA